MSKAPATITKILHRVNKGEKDAYEELFPLVYDQLRSLARARMRSERGGHTLQPTALIHEAFLRLVNIDEITWESRTQFIAVAATAMRRILVDHARSRGAEKRGGPKGIAVQFDEEFHGFSNTEPDLLAFDELLKELSAVNERQGKVVELRFFAGLTIEETAEALSCSTDSVKRDWKKAKFWLYRSMKKAK